MRHRGAATVCVYISDSVAAGATWRSSFLQRNGTTFFSGFSRLPLRALLNRQLRIGAHAGHALFISKPALPLEKFLDLLLASLFLIEHHRHIFEQEEQRVT